ncbi:MULTISPECIES: PepSY domain-containing protein [Kordiimonas]|jgi:uncharacterized iron-regulated membrane protein|uniref:PepSY domain-containing protein n=1 Tax=Kordiimonas TaxID=288021 RepID=UPI002579DADB|nr:PepSY domain-containing protein [Kordiimonas sp. UBA4487]
MNKKNFHKWLSRTHKWLGVLIGLQVLIWSVSGLVIAITPRSVVEGAPVLHRTHPVSAVSPAVLSEVVSQYRPIFLQLRQLGKRTILSAVFSDGHRERYDASTGAQLGPVSEPYVRTVAADYLADDATITAVRFRNDRPFGYPGPLPVWEVWSSSESTPTLYANAETGEILFYATARTQIYEFFKRLHMMDYTDRQMNNRLVVICSAVASLFCVTGLALLPYRIRRGKGRKLRRAKQATTLAGGVRIKQLALKFWPR